MYAFKISRPTLIFLFAFGVSACGGGSENSSMMPSAVIEPQVESEEMSPEPNNPVTQSDYNCGSNDHPRVGQTLVFSTNAHDVGGSAQIVDNCTIRVSAFNYDGGGPLVYFYAGIDGQYREAQGGFALGTPLNGKVYSGDTVLINLTSAVQLDQMNGLSVWCADFNVSFGEGQFE